MDPITTRLDASESVFFTRQLESIDATIFQTLYAENKGRQLLPPVMDVAESSPVYTWRMFSRVGAAVIGGALGDDAPRSDASGAEQSQIIHPVRASFGYTVLEIKEAARTNTPLDTMRANAARENVETAIDRVLATGDVATGLKGLLNLTGVNTYTLADKAGGGKTWAVATANEIVRDVFGMAAALVAQLKEAGGPLWQRFTLVMPVEQYTKIAQERMGDGSDKTILQFILQNSPYIAEIVSWSRCDGAGAGGTTDRMVMYVKQPQVLGALIPMEFTTFPPEARNLAYVVSCLARTGGVVCRYPVALLYADGS